MFALFLCGVRTRKSMTNYELRITNANFANDANGRNSIVNGQLLMVMRGTRRIMKLIVNCQWSMVMRGTRRIMYPENNH